MKSKIIDCNVTQVKSGVQVNITLQCINNSLATISSIVKKDESLSEYLLELLKVCGFHKSNPTKQDLIDLTQDISNGVLDTKSYFIVRFNQKGQPIWVDKCCTEESLKSLLK